MNRLKVSIACALPLHDIPHPLSSIIFYDKKYQPCRLARQGIGAAWLGGQGGVAANSCNPPPTGPILFTGFTMRVCPPSLARLAKMRQELSDRRQGYPLEVGRGKRGNRRGRERKRNRWSNGQRKSSTSWKKGLSQRFSVSQLTCRICRDRQGQQGYYLDDFYQQSVFVCLFSHEKSTCFNIQFYTNTKSNLLICAHEWKCLCCVN